MLQLNLKLLRMIWNYEIFGTAEMGQQQNEREENKYKLIFNYFYFYRCTVHFEDSLIITYQQMH
jgi:hypothetical protein